MTVARMDLGKRIDLIANCPNQVNVSAIGPLQLFLHYR